MQLIIDSWCDLMIKSYLNFRYLLDMVAVNLFTIRIREHVPEHHSRAAQYDF